jgi:hypothetical protein
MFLILPVSMVQNGKTVSDVDSIVENIAFSQPIIKENGRYISINVEGANSCLMETGEPILPAYSKTFEFPFGTKIVDVKCIPSGIRQRTLSKAIIPAPKPVPINSAKIAGTDTAKMQGIYANANLYPDSWYSYRVGCGLDGNEHVVFLTVRFYPIRYSPSQNTIHYASNAEIKIAYEEPLQPIVFPDEYDLVIIAPSKFSDEIQPLVNHKNNYGVNTILKTTEEIYNEFSGVDKPEQIKYFIKDAIEMWNVKYVLLVGGLKSLILANRRDDANQGTKDWYVPVRYSNLDDGGDPGYISDLYYADIYKEGGVFDNWDSNDNGIFAEWKGFKKDTLDLYPDVYVGRLACRNTREVKNVVDKIIKYEQSPADSSWFNKISVVSGDGFQDQEDLDIQWDVSILPDGEYTIYAQSKNPDGIAGPIDVINVTLDRSVESSISFSEEDHLKVGSYPAPPIAEITSPSEGDILGNTDVQYVPPEAYIGDRWAIVEYVNGIMHIRGKSYDPRPYGVVTDIKVWIDNSDGQTIFSCQKNDTKMYYEGEWTTGEKLLNGRGGALYYMPDEFEKIKLWTSNGNFTDQSDVIEAISQGSGFVFFSGHGSPAVWANHYPGIPGGRGHASVIGLANIDLFGGPPFFPMDKLSNTDKLPVVVVGGCHNSQFNVTALSFLNYWLYRTGWTYFPTPECWSWWLTRLPQRGAIATMGNTGLGYGYLGEYCTIGGVDNWITTEFFRQYGEEDHHILGETYGQTITSYINTFDCIKDQIDCKTVQEWVLLGDPSLKIGGYS